MADGGAWQSGVYDNGSDFQKTAAAPKSLVPSVPADGSTVESRDGTHLPAISIVLRVGCIVFSIVAFAVIASNEGSYAVDGYYSYKWWAWRSLNSSNATYMLSINVIVYAYSIVQLILSIVSSCTEKQVLAAPTKPDSTVTFVYDQALMYMLMAGCGAGAASSVDVKKGELGSLSCEDGFRVFCDKGAVATAMSFFAFLYLALSCGMA